MGFKKPKTAKTFRDPLDDGTEHDFDPTSRLSGGRKVSKKKHKNASDAPRSFQYLMDFMSNKQQKDKQQANAKSKARKPQADPDKPKAITETLKIMPNESMSEFQRRVRSKMQNNLELIGTDFEAKEKPANNPSKDEGDEPLKSKRSERKRRNDAIRKQRKLAKKHRNDDDEWVSQDVPRFGEQAQAPPIFKALPKEKFKKMVPLPNSAEEASEKKRREEEAVKKMIQRTARLSPLERMQAKRKAKEHTDSAAEKRIMEDERERAIRRYRMLRAAREAKK
ncbi:hypothetical protein IWW36_004538 [Coemansia brasiliensis]|uniref:Uncharacterized protein n=1 Tax=Coemansia brasiliensis TaxID=2650707 RepID=A0A9W8LYY6_9FUNG|nr:hypothetical protein IWW36_004538 [Coemansia brasiliensis]